MARYAEATKVPVGRSRDELYRVLRRYGATETFVWDRVGGIRVGFTIEGRRVALDFIMPTTQDIASAAAYDRETRRRWRVLILTIKSKLELVEEGAETFDQAFMPYLMLPDGSVVGEHILPMVEESYHTATMPAFPAPEAKVIALEGRVKHG